MPIEASVPLSDGWWLARLLKKLSDRQARLDRLWAYYSGNPPLPVGAESARSAYQAFQAKARVNLAELIVEAPRQRIIPTGFRTGAAGDENGDARARVIWNSNGLDVESAEVHRWMLALGDSYVIVGLDNDGPLITAESPRQVVTEHDPARQRKVLAALKSFRDSVTGEDLAYLYLPGRVLVARREARVWSTGGASFEPSQWDWDEARSRLLPHEVVPVVRFRNKSGVGEFEPHLDHLDRINHMILQRMVIATSQAFRQRVIKGDLPERDGDGNLIDYDRVFSADPGAVWNIPAESDIWESQQAAFQDILNSTSNDIKDLFAVTFTPQYMIAQDASGGSAEGASLAREGLVFKTEGHISRVKDGWAQVMSLAFRFDDDQTRADLASLEPLFASPERYSLAERHDANIKAKAGDVPWHTRMTDILQFSPETVARMEGERGADLMYQLTQVAPAEVAAVV